MNPDNALPAIRPEMELRRLAEAATPGPWYAGHLSDDDSTCNCRYILADDGRMGAVASVHVDDGENDCPPLEEAKANQRYIAAASPDVVLSLIQRVEAMEAALAFYADKANWIGGPWTHAPPTLPADVRVRRPSAIETDMGALARTTQEATNA